DDVLRVNLDSVFNVTKPFIDGMLERTWGRVINISSINGSKGQFGQTNYSAAKAGMHGFTKALAQEVARKGVTVNTISPGYLATKMVMAVPEDVRNSIIAGIPVGRLVCPEDSADLVTFIASESAGCMTGSNVAMNGGQNMYYARSGSAAACMGPLVGPATYERNGYAQRYRHCCCDS